ncbi:MBL fold metallo-hydrolase [Petroclostridium sp. X23]|uniref:MBL fold metallo-hydrolase n=1 Tax=Petroclostridium sp. X23 TaxID=3045146 RepID=UPI0024ACA93A|nr:MBL fold metallo-hydrolase [Petroclostridium sp. X23]WHH57120.1 MBL fold metallo-hydrolase [Petroclostridium sp. X23]
MEKIIVLGTGHALATRYYNTCFVLCNDNDYLLVDGGGGSGILSRISEAKIEWSNLHNIFVTHEHTDHLFGAIWAIRKIALLMLNKEYSGVLSVYCHQRLLDIIEIICGLTLRPVETQLIGDRILLIPVKDGDIKKIIGYNCTFFDIHSKKALQFGCNIILNSKKKLACIGDEPFNKACLPYVKGVDWLLTEAFCLYEHRNIYNPYQYYHSTVKEACEAAGLVGAKNIVLWHTEDDTLSKRKILYTEEGKQYFDGNIIVPDDLEQIML